MTTMRPSRGFSANWMFEPPVSTPTRPMIRRAASRMAWYSLSVSVSAGATVMLSPVCTPIGSMFSIEQMTTKLSATSRITSSSYSFQPISDSSMSTSCTGLIARPRRTISWNSSTLYAMPLPTPPSVNDGRMIDGKPVLRTSDCASSSDRAYPLSGTPMPISFIASRNLSRSSATSMASTDAPMSSTPCRASAPFFASAMARFSAVCPPTVGSSASGRSRAMIASTMSGLSGSTYVRSASSGSVMIVAGLLLTRMTSTPSLFSALHACEPE